jgi:hypothetical protein
MPVLGHSPVAESPPVLAYLLVSQMIVSAAPTPEQSAHILAQLESPSNFSKRFVCTDCDGPHAGVIPSRAGDGPFGPFPQYVFPPLGCCSFYYSGYGYGGHYGGGYYGGGLGWGQGAYVSPRPFVNRGGFGRGGSVVNTGPGPVRTPGGPISTGPPAVGRTRR